MAGAQVPISGEPASTTIATTDLLVAVIGGATKKITAGNARTQLFGFAAADPLNCGAITAVGNSNITGTLSGITALSAVTLALSTGMVSDLLFTDATYDIGKSGATRPRDGFFSRNLFVGGPAGGLTVYNSDKSASHTQAAFGTVDANSMQLTISNSTNVSMNLQSIEQSVNFRSLTLNAAAGEVLLASAGVATRIVGTLAFSTALAKVIPGATSLTFRNSADGANNLSILDNGDSTFDRGNLTLTLGNFAITQIAGTLSIGGNQVVGARITGYTNAWTGAAANKATGYDASTITLPQLAARVRALQESMTTHGGIGV